MDYARGVAIILVVYGHCFRGLLDAGYIPANRWLRVTDYVIYGFHMPLFFFLSGAVSTGTFARAPQQFFRSRLISLGWPYVLWMSVELALLWLLSGATNIGTVDINWTVYLYRPMSPFWFLYALLVAQLLIYPLWRLPHPLVVGLAFAAFVGGQFVPLEIVRLTAWGLFYFYLGLACSSLVRRETFAWFVAKPLVVIAAAISLVSLSLASRLLDIDYRLEVPVAVCGSVLVFGIAERLSSIAQLWPSVRLIGFLGQISLTILVVHVFGTAGSRIALAKAFNVQSVWIYLLAGTAAGLAVPLLLQWTATRLGLLRVLGLPAVHATKI